MYKETLARYMFLDGEKGREREERRRIEVPLRKEYVYVRMLMSGSGVFNGGRERSRFRMLYMWSSVFFSLLAVFFFLFLTRLYM